MATAYDIIRSALRLVGVYAAGEPLQIDDANDGLTVFQDMVNSWNTERLAIFTTRIDDFPFILGQQAYTLGTGGDFNIPRPAAIDAMSAILLTNPDNPVEIPIDMYSVSDWQTQIPIKTVNSSWPQICYDDGGFPLRTLNFWPIPITQPNSCRIYSWQALAEPAALNTVINFPPGYAKAFRYNLAVDLAAEFGVAQVPPVVLAQAISSLAMVKTLNSPDLTLKSDLIPDPSGWNYKADLFNIGL